MTMIRRPDLGPPDVALTGLAGAGKDTAAEILVKRHGYTALKFAQPVYDAVAALDPLLPAPDGNTVRVSRQVHLQGWEQAKRWHPELRRLLQHMGTDVGRKIIDPDVWVDLAVRRRDQIGTPVVWTDARFANEIDYVRGERHGLWVHVQRDVGGYVSGTDLDNERAAHESENSLPSLSEADGVLVNDRDVTALHCRFEAMLGLPITAQVIA